MLTTITVKRATAIRCWDVFVNGQRLDRFDTKQAALDQAETYKNLTRAMEAQG